MKKREFLKTGALAATGLLLGGPEALATRAFASQNAVPQDRNAMMQAAMERRTRLKAPVTARGKIGNVEVSRLILGGNPFGGWMHSRDLRYVPALAKAYLTEGKVMEIFQMAENCGINTIAGHPVMIDILTKYWNRGIGKIQWISDCGGTDFIEAAKRSVDAGACAGYCQGQNCDALVEKGDFATIEKGLQILRDAGLPAGLGAHSIKTFQACIARGIVPDFWFKTLHHLNYWSAMTDKPRRDNVYCEDAEETIAYMETRPEPLVAFKVMAAGAIPPAEGIQYGLDGGGDFLCLGMFDFNMIEDVNLFNEALAKVNRKRPWRG